MRLSITHYSSRSLTLTFRSPALQRSALTSRAMAPKRNTKKKTDEDFVDDDEELEVEEKPKKKRAAAAKSKKVKEESDDDDDLDLEDEEEDDDDFEVDDEEEEEKPKKKKAAPAKKAPAAAKKPRAPPKKKAKKEEEEDEGEGDEDAPSAKKSAAKPRAKNPPNPTEKTTLDDGWTVVPPSLLYKLYGEDVKSTKIAAFDFDGTLVQVKSGAKFPLNADDWVLHHPDIPAKLKQYHDQGFKIAIFRLGEVGTYMKARNQGGIKAALVGKSSDNFRLRMDNVVKKLGVPVVAFAATMTDDFRKPNTGMWKYFCEHFMDGQEPDLSVSFYVGDNVGGAQEGDAGFAAGVGIGFRTEEQEFGKHEIGGENKELVAAFKKLADLAKVQDPDKGHFKAAAFNKAANAISNYSKKIINDPKVLKEVNALQGVGKGSMAVIKEFLETGKVAGAEQDPLSVVPGGEGGDKPAPPVSKLREDAEQFM